MRKLSKAVLLSSLLAASPVWADATASASAEPVSSAEQQQQQRPNVLVWMLDDVGFAQLGCFGGLIATPNIDRVAQMGLRYSNYRTAPICSASRAALLSGRNSHSVHVGSHAASARDFPGYDAHIPASAGSIADNLHQAGYRTFALGKWDHLPTEEATLAGPFNQWPSGQGFDHFYGFLGADNDNFNPILIQGTTPIARPDTQDYHLNNDLAERAIAMIHARDGASAPAPFFGYWATSTAHAPHHAPAEWIARYRGKFDLGWDEAREDILAHQKEQGLVPAGAILAPPPPEVPAWTSLSADQRKLYARQMEVFAASLSHADEQFGRILDALEARGELENTIVIITSDNGASAEGGPEGSFSELTVFNKGTARIIDGKRQGHGATVGLAENMKFYDEWGGPKTYPHYSVGWAIAGNTPFRYFKQTAHEGGIHVPLVISWPAGIAARGEQRDGFVHVSDIAPTILEAAGVPLAETVNNVAQQPMEGRSFVASFTKAAKDAPGRAQYFEMFGNRSLWSDGWSIATTHRYKTWEHPSGNPTDEPWELYDLQNDPGQVTDLAAQHPERVAALDRKFDEQARRFNVYPVMDLATGADQARREAGTEFARRGGKWRYSGMIGNIPGMAGPPVLFRDFTMTAHIDMLQTGVTGPVFGFDGQMGGMGLYLRDGRPVFVLVSLDGNSIELAASEALPAGKTKLRLTFDRANVRLMEPGDHKATILANDRLMASGTLRYAMPMTYGVAETFAVGIDNGSPVLAGAKPDVPLSASIGEVVFDFSGGEQ
ncbi:MAG: arylsulfatase [Novosphingobium sp.]|nr:arylsulfatase [Novosphingobium sp.]